MKKINLLIRDERGAITVLTVILLAAFVGILALVIDLGHLHTVQGELRNAADACALRGARGFLPDDIDISAIKTAAPSPDDAKNKAHQNIVNNKSDNLSLNHLPVEDIQVGIWDYTARKLLSWQWPPDASMWGQYIGPGVSLPVKREGSYNLGPVSMTLARIFGISTVPVNTMATAALSGVGGFHENSETPEFPVCINVDKVQARDGEVVFNPDGDDTGGWTNLRPASEGDHTDAADIKKFFRGEIGPGDLPPGTQVSLNNGVMCSATKTLIEEADRWHLTPKPDTKNTWKGDPSIGYLFAVCTKDKFNQWHTVGAVAATLVEVGSAPDDCKLVIEIIGDATVGPDTYGGGAWYGVMSTEPKLVE